MVGNKIVLKHYKAFRNSIKNRISLGCYTYIHLAHACAEVEMAKSTELSQNL